MSVAAIYDIHGNLPALEAVLGEIRDAEVDLVVIGGDVVPGPMSRESLSLLMDLDLPTRLILGNTDREVLAQMENTTTDWYRTAPKEWREPVKWAAQQLQSEDGRWLSKWTKTCSVEVNGLGRVLFCHATPRSDTEIFTRLTAESRLLPLFEGLDVSIVVCGHTHMQFDRMVGQTRVVNAGSVGMPFGKPGAYWLLLGPNVDLRQTAYDLTIAAERIGNTEYPNVADFVDNHVVQPPSEAKMIKVFGQVELSD